MNYFRQQITHFFNTFSIYNFIMLVFGLPFLSEGLFLFFRQSFLNNLYHPLYLLLFAALIFLYGNFFSQVQSNEKGFQNFSLKAAFVSFAYWLLLSPIFFFRFYQLLLAWQPLPARMLSFIFLYRWKILPVIIFLYLIVLYFLYRMILVPKYLKQGKSIKESRKLSWQKTENKLGKQLLLFFLIPFAFLTVSFLMKIGVIWLSQYLIRQTSAMIFLVIYRVLQNVWWGLFFLYLTASDKKPVIDDSTTKGTIVWLGLTILVCLGLYSLHYAHAFQIEDANAPFTISHRGVTNRNGVQNSIAALKRTSLRDRPDYIEMDVQETLEDNGYTSKIPLFADYLAEANRLNQKLLIELKVTNKTKSTIVQQLLPLKEQLANHQLQSMDLDSANKMKQLFPTMKVGYILPLDLIGAPKTSLDFMNIEARTANNDLIQVLQKRNQAVYVWPVNSNQQMAVYRCQNVTGILTDDLSVFSVDSNRISIKTASILQFD